MADMCGSSSDGSGAMEEVQSSDSETNDPANDANKRDQRMQDYHKNCQHLMTYLKTHKFPPSLAKKDYRNIRNQARTHLWDAKDKKLYYIGGKKGSRKLVLTSTSEIDVVISEGHVRSDGTHMGVNNTLAAISCKYIWASMKLDIANYVSACNRCRLKNRSAIEKIQGQDPLELVQVDMFAGEEPEFSYEATVMLIEAIKKRYGNLSSRQARLSVYKEVQEELSQHGHNYSVTRVRRKWNSLVEMHKRMRRDIYQKNPPWQFYMMIDGIDKEDTSATPQEETYPPHQEETNYAHQEAAYPTHHAITYANNNQANPYVTQHENIYSGHHGNAYAVHQGHSFPAQPAHQGNTNPMIMPPSAAFFKCDPNQSRLVPPQGHTLRLPPAHPLETPLVGPSSVPHQPPAPSVPCAPPNIRKEVQRLGVQQVLVNNQLKEMDFRCTKEDSSKRRDRMDRLKVKHLKKISKELQSISAAQNQILSKQDQLLSAVMGQM